MAAAAQFQPQILRRPESILQIHPIRATPNSSVASPYNYDSVSSPESGDRGAPPLETPPPPPPSNTRRPEWDDDLVFPATPDSDILLKARPSYADIVKRHKSRVSEAHLPRQPTARTLQSAITSPGGSTYYGRGCADEPSRRLRMDDAPRGCHDDPSSRRAALRWQPTSPTPCDFNSVEPGWFKARVKHWWRKLQSDATSESLQRHRPSNRAPRPRRGQLRAAATTSPALQAFRLITKGKCFKCLAPDHRAASCREPFRCFRCRKLGHRERDCKSSAAQRACKEELPPPPPPRPGQAMVMLGDPETRPDEDECLIPT